MRKFLSFLLICLLSSQVFAANEWRNGSGENTILGTENASDIDTASYQNIVEPLDRVLSDYYTTRLDYTSASTITVVAGSVVCSNSDGSVRRMRSNSSNLTLTWSNIDTGSENSSTTYYVYLVADADSEEYTGVISSNATTPSGVTYYARIGSFFNNGSSNITLINNPRGTQIGSLASRSKNVTYQASTDGFVTCFGSGDTVGTSQHYGYTDSSSSPSTLVCQFYYLGSASEVMSFTMPVKEGDYYRVTTSTNGSTTIYWTPLQ